MGELTSRTGFVYSYKKDAGWFPHLLGGWVRLSCAVQVWETREEVEGILPKGCRVVRLGIEYKEKTP